MTDDPQVPLSPANDDVLCTLKVPGELHAAFDKVESGCGAVAVGRACLLPPLSSGGALVARP